VFGFSPEGSALTGTDKPEVRAEVTAPLEVVGGAISAAVAEDDAWLSCETSEPPDFEGTEPVAVFSAGRFAESAGTAGEIGAVTRKV
jgi:hypothetical protein